MNGGCKEEVKNNVGQGTKVGGALNSLKKSLKILWEGCMKEC